MDDLSFGYKPVVEEISGFNWDGLSEADLTAAAHAYYYFSIQFRENLQLACRLYPGDGKLTELLHEECNTANLSPWPGVAIEGESLDHDEFMRRVLKLSSIDPDLRRVVDDAGVRYLARTRDIDDHTRAMSIATYEDGGLEAVFLAILRASRWNTPLLQGFRHFLMRHIEFDGNAEGGHGSMVRHLGPNDNVRRLWVEFRTLLVTSVPRLVM